MIQTSQTMVQVIEGKLQIKHFLSEVKHLVQESKSVLKISSFQIIVAQGITGSFPWSALSIICTNVVKADWLLP